MANREPRIGIDYLTCSGLPVRVVSLGQDCLTLQSLASDNRLHVPNGYPLKRARIEGATVTARARPYQPRGPMAKREPSAPKPLASIIDALLLEGGRTMRGIARELRRKASAACKGRDIHANIRARLYWLKRAGYRTEISENGHLRISRTQMRRDFTLT